MPFDSKTREFRSRQADVYIPTGTIDSFIFDYDPTQDPAAKSSGLDIVKRSPRQDALWLIDGLSGRSLTFKQAKERHEQVAAALRKTHKLGSAGPGKDVLAIYSGNEVDYPIAAWAAFRCDAIVSGANPSYTTDELGFQLELISKHKNVKVLVASPDSIEVAVKAVEKAKLSKDIIVLIKPADKNTPESAKKVASQFKTIDDLLKDTKGAPVPPKVKLSGDDGMKKIAFLSFSSGTTGLPKAVEIPHRALIANVTQISAHWGKHNTFRPYDPKTGKGDKVLGVLPFYHIYGLVVVLHHSLWENMPVVTMSKFVLPDFLGTVQRHKISVLYVVPPIVVALVKQPMCKEYDLSSVRLGMAGAAPLTVEIFNALKKTYPTWEFGQGYGMTETCTVITVFEGGNKDKIKGDSAGVIVPNIRCKIMSPEGKALGPGEVGELWSWSPSNALGYLGNAKATEETFTDNWVHTGDEGVFRKESDGTEWLYIVDRIKELIKVKGNQVAPAELEGFLLGHDDVADACVIGIPDERAGERPKAYIVLSTSAAEKVKKDKSSAEDKIKESVMKYVADNKIAYKQLGEVSIIDAIPKNPSGKLLRKELRALHAKESKGKSKL